MKKRERKSNNFQIKHLDLDKYKVNSKIRERIRKVCHDNFIELYPNWQLAEKKTVEMLKDNFKLIKKIKKLGYSDHNIINAIEEVSHRETFSMAIDKALVEIQKKDDLIKTL